jgi:hypothetical protein
LEETIMKKISMISLLILGLALAVLVGCGGGGGGGGAFFPVAQPTTAVVTLSTQVTTTLPANTIITGYDVTITLPAGVTVKSTNPPLTDAGVVTDNPAGSSMDTNYTKAAGAIPGTVRIVIAKADGYSAGVFSKVNCNVAAGVTVKASDFPHTFTASGFDTVAVSNVDITTDLTLTAVVN